MTNGQGIEILSVELCRQSAALIREFRQISDDLEIGLGWHYILDLSWTARQLRPRAGMRVLDAGAGFGIMQWWLASRHIDVISVDRIDRQRVPRRIRERCQIRSWPSGDLRCNWRTDLIPPGALRRWPSYPKYLAAALRSRWRAARRKPGGGTVFLYEHDVTSMPHVADDSVDVVVSISALEHNSPDCLRLCVRELLRVLRPGGKLIATLAAARERDWYHEPSKGWCYTEATLRDLFDLPPDCPSNYERHDELFEALRTCGELRDTLAPFYFASGNNGMPWGMWDPKYQPVGVVKIKGSG